MELFKIFEDFSAEGIFHKSSYIPSQRDLNTLLPVKWSKGHFFKKFCFSPVKNVKNAGDEI